MLFTHTPECNILRYQVNNLCVCVCGCISKKLFLLCFVSSCFLILTLWFYYCIFQSFFLDQYKSSEKFYGCETYLPETMLMTRVGEERGVCITDFNPLRSLGVLGVNLVESSLLVLQFRDAVESIQQPIAAEGVEGEVSWSFLVLCCSCSLCFSSQ